jgi:hypothetical protein
VVDTLLALLAVVAVLAVHGLIKLLILPFRIVRDLFRHSRKLPRITGS